MNKNEIKKLSDYKLVKNLKRHLKKRPVIKLKDYFGNPEIDIYFEEIYSRYQKKIRYYCGKIIYDKDSLDDIFHEVFINIYLNIHKFKLKHSLKSWIYKIAYNVSINFIHKSHHKEKLILNKKMVQFKDSSIELLESVREEKEDLEKNVFTRDLKGKVSNAFELLPPDFKSIYSLKVEFNFTYEDIADIIGLSSRQVKTKYKQLTRLLKKELLKHDITHKYLD